jgi:hypothetical protein
MEEIIINLISQIKNQWLVFSIVSGAGLWKVIKPFLDLKLKNLEKKEDSELKAHESSFELIKTLVNNQIDSGKEMSKMVSEAISSGFEKVCHTLNINFTQNHGDHTDIKLTLNKQSEILEVIKNKLGA